MIDPRFEPERFLRRVRAVPEPDMREALWRECFEALSPEALGLVVEAVLAALARRDEAGQVGYFSLLRYLEAAGPAAAAALAEAGRAMESEVIPELLVRLPPLRTVEPGALRPPPVDADREVTLGERRSMARRPDRATLDRLLLDQDVGVIRNLLQNPRITEQDVLKMASRRPTSAAVLTTLFHHPRWGRRRVVQLALVYNPYTPVEIAAGLVDLLDLEAARQLATEPGVHPAVQRRAAVRAGRRPPVE